jgi:hypothetical protein
VQIEEGPSEWSLVAKWGVQAPSALVRSFRSAGDIDQHVQHFVAVRRAPDVG